MRIRTILKSIIVRMVTVSDPALIKAAIDRHPVISFDVFDTLLRRDVTVPADVFDRVEKAYNLTASRTLTDFKRIRMAAERKARRLSPTEETNIWAIYHQMPYGREVKVRLLELELAIERSGLSVRPEIKEWYDYVQSIGKEVLIVSDMYLPIGFMESVLQENGCVGYQKLYLSSETGVSKSTGHMFRFVLKDTGYKAQDIVHIGDNPRGDWLMPRLCGMDSVCVES